MAQLVSARTARSANWSALVPKDSGSTETRDTSIDQRTWANDFRKIYTEACPSASLVKTSPHWDFGSFCSTCVKPHSRGQLVDDWAKSLDACEQPDLGHLHSFFMTNPSLPPVRTLMPLFSPFKIEGFSDILFPLSTSRMDEPDYGEIFTKRKDALFWSGSIGNHALSEQATRGNHNLRLLHLLKDANIRDRVTMVLPVPGSHGKFKSHSVPVAEANRDLSFQVGTTNDSACIGKNCHLLKQVYGTDARPRDPLQHRYILLTDEDDGPPKATVRMLASQSLPFISTIFQTWYSDRLTPWLHFVPVDSRYQALHTTLLYFSGTSYRAKMNGINTYIMGRSDDAEWIAQQGQRWVQRALQSRDMEVYLFRLLLEWGRLIDDRRDEIGYRRGANGVYQNDAWIPQQ
ncbi:hypothetical protein UVI_02002620 [Ustilaginoidea virens]|nr:hypothetical protein UVI_02002620 [Ustilaginoidea virens]